MQPHGTWGLPSFLLLLLAARVEAQQRHPTAIRKVPADSSHKLLPEHFAFEEAPFGGAFEPHPFLSPREAILADRLRLSVEEEARLSSNSSDYAGRQYRPAFNAHHSQKRTATDERWGLLRRAGEALNVLQGRQTCPGGMNSCEDIGVPNKCCSINEVCVEVEDDSVGNVACCPQGSDCDGAVANCPDGSPACSAELGGGCCIPGFVCQGVGCVPSAAPSPSAEVSTVTTTSTSTAEGGEPSTVVVTVIITATPDSGATTVTTTSTSTPNPSTTSGGAAPPWRPTSEDETTAATTTTESEAEEPSGTQPPDEYCPTGFYACLAREGGGCCRTGRDCATTDCPSTPSTTIVTEGATVVVPVTDVPDAQASETCANGWFLCGEEAGPVAGCCPSGYECGRASCSTVTASQTEEIQKQFPESESDSDSDSDSDSGAGCGGRQRGSGVRGCVVAAAFGAALASGLVF